MSTSTNEGEGPQQVPSGDDQGGGSGPVGPVVEAVGDVAKKSVETGRDVAETTMGAAGDVMKSGAEMMRDTVPEMAGSGAEAASAVAGATRDTVEA
ncbi:MAG: hypothetical protein M3P34_02085, partial [Actinomycetota bacterium]|nr:hypothetical protein [Actinomycetota bacterium]